MAGDGLLEASDPYTGRCSRCLGAGEKHLWKTDSLFVLRRMIHFHNSDNLLTLFVLFESIIRNSSSNSGGTKRLCLH